MDIWKNISQGEKLVFRGMVDSSDCRSSLNNYGGSSLENQFFSLGNIFPDIQTSFINLSDFLEIEPFEHVEFLTTFTQINGTIIHQIEKLKFPIFSHTLFNLSDLYYPQANSVMEFSGLNKN